MLSSLGCDEISSKQRLSCHRRSGREVSQQSIETHLQRPQVGGQVSLEEMKDCQLNMEPQKERSRGWGSGTGFHGALYTEPRTGSLS